MVLPIEMSVGIKKEPSQHYMKTALVLAQRGLGCVWPNPAVGCLLVKDNNVVGRGWTQSGGRPHAESVALQQAGSVARGATVYVTLEPCSHHGKTPPCIDALIDAGVSRVVIAREDPDPRVSGRGIAALKAAGITTEVGLLRQQATFLNAGFFSRIERNRPLVTLKFASSLDSRIALANGQSQWVTGNAGRAYGHRLRAEYDAILVSVRTVLKDNPQLTCRFPGLEDRSPIRLILDKNLEVSSEAKSLSDQVPTWILTATEANIATKKINNSMVEIIQVPTLLDGHLDLKAAMVLLGRRGLTRVLVEGGAELSMAFLKAQLVDRIVWIRAQTLLGGDAIPVSGPLDLQNLDAALHLTRIEDPIILDKDIIEGLNLANN
ncbi:MAG: bifunctional diaminohydroxyphosphoribosylaminopyrimidine deaminase/5-amino-6-(5-phosphoribosylamino)uracil reductase RibD [Alphaproteobacteria bacterium]